jgi:hypothetical protein
LVRIPDSSRTSREVRNEPTPDTSRRIYRTVKRHSGIPAIGSRAAPLRFDRVRDALVPGWRPWRRPVAAGPIDVMTIDPRNVVMPQPGDQAGYDRAGSREKIVEQHDTPTPEQHQGHHALPDVVWRQGIVPIMGIDIPEHNLQPQPLKIRSTVGQPLSVRRAKRRDIGIRQGIVDQLRT